MKLKFFSLLAAVFSGCAALWELTFGVQATVHIYAFAIFKAELSSAVWLVPLIAGTILLYLMRKRVTLFEYALRPLLLSGAVFFWPNDSSGMFCYALALLVWSAYRLGSLYYRKIPAFPELKENFSLPLVALLTLAAFGLSWYFQYSAFKALYLIFGDWGQYTECYLAMASGSASFKQWLCAAGHFNPLINLLMAGAIKLYSSEQSIFCVNAAVIAAAVPLSYTLARSNGLKGSMALLCAFLAAVYPIFTRQSLCLFYGFHPIVFFMPLLLCFFIAKTRECTWGMSVCIVLSLLIQETVAVFWIGWGLYLFVIRKKYVSGVLLALAMVGWFALLSLVVQPWGGEAAVYAQSFRYAALGDSPIEIALSPILRPGAFWSALLSPRNLLFTSIIIVPVFFAAVSFPALLLMGLPLLGGFFVQSTDTVKTPLLQYGVELGTLCWAAAIINLGRIFKGEKSCLTPRGNIKYGIVCALCTGIFIGYFFFGYGYKFGLYPKDYCFFKEDVSNVIAFLKKNLPEKTSRLLAAQRVRAHFMFDYPTAALSDDYKTGDWILLDLHDPAFESPEKIEPLRRKLYNDPRCRPVTYANWYGKHLVLLYIAAADTPHKIVPYQIPGEQFRKAAGMMFVTNHPQIECKYDGRMLHFRLKEKLKADYDLDIQLKFPNGKIETFTYSWYFGLFPAWSQSKGTLWSVPVKPGFNQCALIFKERPESSESATGAGQGKNSKTPAKAH